MLLRHAILLLPISLISYLPLERDPEAPSKTVHPFHNFLLLELESIPFSYGEKIGEIKEF